MPPLQRHSDRSALEHRCSRAQSGTGRRLSLPAALGSKNPSTKRCRVRQRLREVNIGAVTMAVREHPTTPTGGSPALRRRSRVLTDAPQAIRIHHPGLGHERWGFLVREVGLSSESSCAARSTILGSDPFPEWTTTRCCARRRAVHAISQPAAPTADPKSRDSVGMNACTLGSPLRRAAHWMVVDAERACSR